MASLCAYLSYPDAPAVVEWLTALGFGVVQRADDGDRVLHAEERRTCASKEQEERKRRPTPNHRPHSTPAALRVCGPQSNR